MYAMTQYTDITETFFAEKCYTVHCTCKSVIHFMPIRKIWSSQHPHCHIIHKCSPALCADLLLDGISNWTINLIFTKVKITPWTFVDIPYAQFYPNHLKNVQNMEKISFMPLSKPRLSLYHFHKTQKCSVAMHTDPPYRSSSQSVKTCRKCKQKFIYTLT